METQQFAKAYITEDAGSTSWIRCNINGKPQIAHCSIMGCRELNEALPRLQKGEWMIVIEIDNKWMSTMVFQACTEG